ncbi:unnamed protein product [Pleuronectes platessa]|uniref:Uncharacterized protein n=1 Tax=Pleuronectes platessa TaxID=8262 RepID=A0A9N7U7P7_PLEPL|nr:unnamed protein product [Pleuronectes platessa]
MAPIVLGILAIEKNFLLKDPQAKKRRAISTCSSTGGESSQALFGILPAGTGESIDPTEPLNLSAELVTLTPVELAFEEPSTSQSPVLEEMWNPPAPPPPSNHLRKQGGDIDFHSSKISRFATIIPSIRDCCIAAEFSQQGTEPEGVRQCALRPLTPVAQRQLNA